MHPTQDFLKMRLNNSQRISYLQIYFHYHHYKTVRLMNETWMINETCLSIIHERLMTSDCELLMRSVDVDYLQLFITKWNEMAFCGDFSVWTKPITVYWMKF